MVYRFYTIDNILNRVKMKKIFLSANTWTKLIGLSLILLFTSCAAKESVEQCLTGETYGFFWGIWHGIIAPISLVVSLFDKDVAMFAVNNSGFFYALGFLFGSGGWGILASKAKKD